MTIEELMLKYEGILTSTKGSNDRYTNGKYKAFKEVLKDLKHLKD